MVLGMTRLRPIAFLIGVSVWVGVDRCTPSGGLEDPGELG
jgi:hypothetical protein